MELGELYIQAQRMLYDEVPVIPLVYLVFMTGISNKVTGFVGNPFRNLDFSAVQVRP